MTEEDHQDMKQAMRRRLNKIRSDCESLLMDAAYYAAYHADVAPQFAPDVYADVQRKATWARQAVAALDADDPIPSPPEEPDAGRRCRGGNSSSPRRSCGCRGLCFS